MLEKGASPSNPTNTPSGGAGVSGSLAEQLKVANDRLRQAEDRLAITLANSDVTAFEQDLDLRYTWVHNSKLYADGSFVIGKTEFDLFEPELARKVDSFKRWVLRSKRPGRENFVVRSPTKEAEFFEVYVEPRYDAAGQIVGCIGTTTRKTEIITAERGAEQIRAKLAAALENMSEAVVICDQNGHFSDYNDAFVKLLRFSSAQEFETKTAGDPGFLEILSLDDVVIPYEQWPLRRAMSGETDSDIELKLRRTDTGEAWYISCSFAPIMGAGGAIVGCVQTARDITERKLAEYKFQAEGAKLAAALEHISDAIGICDVDGTFYQINSAFATFHRFASKDECTMALSDYAEFLTVSDSNGNPISPGQWPLRRALAGEVVDEKEYVCRRTDTGEEWLGACSFAPIRDVNGEVIGAVSCGRDITDQRRAAERIKSEKAKLRAAIESMSDAVFIADTNGHLIEFNEAFATFHRFASKGECGSDLASWIGFLDICSLDGTPLPRDAHPVPRALSGDSASDVELLMRRSDLNESWIASFNFAPIRDSAGAIAGAVVAARDISARKVAEEHTKMLMAEVNHRAKNLLSVVQAVATQTVSVDEAVAFGERLSGLAASHDLLVRSEWQGVGLRDLLQSQLSHFSALIGDRITLDGPTLQLTATAAQAIGMAIHELATNAAKYGALSVVSGKVSIAWRLTMRDGKEWFEAHWQERDGAPVSLAIEPSFGHTVMVDMLEHSLGAKVALTYPPSGADWRMSALIERMSPRSQLDPKSASPA